MITDKIAKTIAKYNMLKSGDTVVVGVSGGADSMLLLNYLFDNKERYNINLIAANVEHGIRGEDSLNDTEFVKSFCQEKGIDFRCVSINAKENAKAEKLGVEEYSRNKRYDFFNSVGADKIATAHNLTDNAETLLFRLVRGTSNKGAGAIPPVRDNIIRPLIECTSKEIREYCKEKGIPYVVDKTNFENGYSRNYIRNEILPLLERLNPQYEEALSRYIASAAEDEECLKSLAEKYAFPVSLESFKGEFPAVQKRVIQLYAKQFGLTLDETHLTEALALCYRTGKTQLKGNLFAVSDGKLLKLEYIENAEDEPAFSAESRIVDISRFLEKKEILKKEFAFFCDYDKIVGKVSQRVRQSGDSLTLADRGVSKSLKKLMNELKIPPSVRNKTAVIYDEDGVIGLYGYTLSERVKIDKSTKKVYLLKISLEDNPDEKKSIQ